MKLRKLISIVIAIPLLAILVYACCGSSSDNWNNKGYYLNDNTFIVDDRITIKIEDYVYTLYLDGEKTEIYSDKSSHSTTHINRLQQRYEEYVERNLTDNGLEL